MRKFNVGIYESFNINLDFIELLNHPTIRDIANQIDNNGIVIDIKQFINDETLKQFIPNKVLILKKEDIMNLIV